MAGSAALADAPVHLVVTVDPQASKSEISTEAEGLSYESAVLQPDREGGHYFSPRNTTLIRLFRTVGVKSLRLGGVTVDLPNLVITQADIDELFEFARAADVKVIYSFRLKDGDIQAIKPLARHIFDRYAANLDCIAFGNEPNEFMANYAMYEKAWMPFLDAVSQENPGMKFCGPSAWKEDWARQFAIDISDERAKRIAFVAQHVYAFGPQKLVKDNTSARDRMLSVRDYDNSYRRFVPTILERGLHYRIEESSNYSNGGREDVSDTYAAALWALDYLYWWCAHDSLGVNFHTGDRQHYSAFKTAADGYEIRPLSYGLLAFSLGGHGRFIATKTEMPGDPLPSDLRVYATKTVTDDIFVTLINRSHGVAGRAAQVSVVLPDSFSKMHAEVCYLAAPNSNISAKIGITIGGAEIGRDGGWNGKWSVLAASVDEHQIQINVPAASAAMLKLTKAER